MKKLPKVNTSKLLKAALPYILVGLMATKLGQAYRMASGGDVLDRILGAFLKIGEAFANPLPSLHPFDLLVGDACGALLWFIVYQKSKNARKYRRGAEYGTARWGNAKDIEPFIDPDFSQNILLSETERLTLGKIADPEKRNVNLNVLVIGGSGSGKTRYHIKPNLLQMNASYVCSDPKGKGLPHQSGNYDFCGIYPDVGDLKLRAAGLHHGNGRQFRGNLGSLAGAVLCADWSGLLADCGCADCWYLRKGSCGVQLRRSVWCSEYQFRGRNGYAGRHPECFRLWTA